MNCYVCQINKIDPKYPPFGGFVCDKHHLQCIECNANNNGKCVICQRNTIFLKMCYNSLPEQHVHVDQVYITQDTFNQIPTAPSLNLLSDVQEFNTEAMFASAEAQKHLRMDHIYKSSTRSIDKESVAIETYIHKSFGSKECTDKRQYDPHSSKMNYEYTNPQMYKLTNNNYNAAGPSNTAKEEKTTFPFHVDNDESHIIDTSEIRFMDSTDSLHSFCMNSVSHEYSRQCNSDINSRPKSIPNISSEPHQQIKQHEGLCVEMVKNFDSLHPTNRDEWIHHYLQSYATMQSYDIVMHKNQQWLLVPMPTNVVASTETKTQTKSIAVSTESPLNVTDIVNNNNKCKQQKQEVPESFKLQEAHSSKTDLQVKSEPNEILVMPVMNVIKPTSYLSKITDASAIANKLEDNCHIDERFQKILEIIQEDTELQKFFDKKENQDQSKNKVLKIPTTLAPTIKKADDKESSVLNEVEGKDQLKQDNKVVPTWEQQEDLRSSNALDFQYVVNIYRACYNPSSLGYSKPAADLFSNLNNSGYVVQDLPPAQFEQISFSKNLAQEVSVGMKPLCVSALQISRCPIQCPETNCARHIFVVDLSKHLISDHAFLTVERIAPFEYKNFCLNPRLSHCGITKCHLLYLMKDKIVDLGNGKYKDLLPLLVMSSKINIGQICSVDNKTEVKNKQSKRGVTGNSSNGSKEPENVEFFIIWVIGFNEIPVSYTLTVWANTGATPKCHAVYSGEVYSIRESQKGIDVYNNGHTLMLSHTEINILTKGAQDMLYFQLVAH